MKKFSKLLLILIFISTSILNISLAEPSNIILLLGEREYYIVKADEDEIPKGFNKDKLKNFSIVVEAYKNGPLTICKISDEEYNYRFVAIDENSGNKPYELITQEIDEIKYYIIPYQIEEYKNSNKNLSSYRTMVRNQIITCYSTDEYLFEKELVYGIDNEGNLKVLTYEKNQDEFKLYDEITTKNEEKLEIATNEKNQDEVKLDDKIIAKNRENNYKLAIILLLLVIICTILIKIKKEN